MKKPLKCKIGFHDYEPFRWVEEADAFGLAVADQVCLSCGKFDLSGTKEKKLNDEYIAHKDKTKRERKETAISFAHRSGYTTNVKV